MSLSRLARFFRRRPPASDGARRVAIERMYDRLRMAFPTVSDIDATTLQARMAAGDDLVLVDVRPADERSVSVLAGAISLDELAGDGARYAGRTLVTYCTIGLRSGRTARDLQRRGHTVLNLRGSLLSWTHARGGLVTPDGVPTRDVHVYAVSWAYTATGYRAVVTDRTGTVVPV